MKIVKTLFNWFKSESALDLEDLPLAEGEDPFDEPVVWEITDTIDLHSVLPREINAVVVAYLDEALARGFTRVRIIHGKGIGVQREAVRRILARTEFVREFHDAADASGWGATIAVLTVPEKKNAMAEGNRL
jgi:dsDNA-specific endonuclease/ATPase MutS2